MLDLQRGRSGKRLIQPGSLCKKDFSFWILQVICIFYFGCHPKHTCSNANPTKISTLHFQVNMKHMPLPWSILTSSPSLYNFWGLYWAEEIRGEKLGCMYRPCLLASLYRDHMDGIPHFSILRVPSSSLFCSTAPWIFFFLIYNLLSNFLKKTIIPRNKGRECYRMTFLHLCYRPWEESFWLE